MKYKIDENESGIDISINDVNDKKEKLLEAFQECQEGRCSYPTEEYKRIKGAEHLNFPQYFCSQSNN